LDKLDQSGESLTRALELQPNNPKAHFYLGLLNEKMERYDVALNHFEHAKADKMIQKMHQKMDEQRRSKMTTLLPFEILEVLGEGAVSDTIPASEARAIPAAIEQSEWNQMEVDTGKMKRHDVREAMPKPEESLFEKDETVARVESPMIAATQPVAPQTDEEELVEDT